MATASPDAACPVKYIPSTIKNLFICLPKRFFTEPFLKNSCKQRLSWRFLLVNDVSQRIRIAYIPAVCASLSMLQILRSFLSLAWTSHLYWCGRPSGGRSGGRGAIKGCVGKVTPRRQHGQCYVPY